MARKLVWMSWLSLILLAACASPQWPEPPAPPPLPAPGQWLEGPAGWYGELFQGHLTTSGEQFDLRKLTGSHGSLPLGAKVEVVFPETQKSVVVVINDRHHLDKGRVLCLSEAAAKALGAHPLGAFLVQYRLVE